MKPDRALLGQPFYRRDPYASILGLLGIFFISQVAAGILIALYPALKNWTSEEGTVWLNSSTWARFFYILLAEVFSVWLVLWALKHIRVARARIGLIKPVSKDIAYALAGYAIYFVIYVTIIIAASNISPVIDIDQPQQIGFEAASGRGELALIFLSLAILPPIAEEIMFRGFLFTSLRAKYRFGAAAIITSILFGIAHLQFGSGAPLLWVAAIDTFVLSIVLCYLREKSGSLWPGIFLHTLKNSIAFTVLFHSRF